METYGIEKLGIVNPKAVYRNLTPAQLTEAALRRGEGKLSNTGALVVTTGKYTGRSPKDKFIVDTPSVHDDIAWGSVNVPITQEKFNAIRSKVIAYLQNREIFIFDGMAGADPVCTRKFRIINELASQNLFIHELLIRPTAEELENYGEADFTIFVAPGFKCIPEIDGTHSEAAIIVDYEQKQVVICGSQYSGEIKKSVFSVMNFLMPKEGVLPMHCSANMDPETHETAVFFGLSGTGKTTLSADPNRKLIGDDEHGWSDRGIFNFEGGCYAKVINLDKESEPDIYNAIKRNALLENVTVDANGKIDFADKSVTENTRVSYPIFHINNIQPGSSAPAAKQVIFLSADAFGVLPPVSILTPEQTKYYFLSGFTAKLAGTERGITEPTPTFSACFGQAFLELHPTKYAEELVKKMEKNNAKAYLVNTGWNGTGKRISIRDTRGIIDAILSGDIDKAPTKQIPMFDFKVPTVLPGVATEILDPRDTYADAAQWEEKAKDLAARFIKNFKKYENNEAGKALVAAGPKL
mgnify:CR=1 FL=1